MTKTWKYLAASAAIGVLGATALHAQSYPNQPIRLLPGRYRLWCSVADHAQLGMRAVLRVRR